MNFTFGIITIKNNEEQIIKIIESIRKQNITNYEIIIVGSCNIQGNDITIIPFDEKIKYTRKKNIITELAKYENVVYSHDYIYFDDKWYEGQLISGENFEIRVDQVRTINDERYRDWVIWPHNNNFMDNIVLPTRECMLSYDITHLTKYMYISGIYWVAKKEFMLKYPLNENLGHHEGEDVEWSKRVRQVTNFNMNKHSIVRFLKEKEKDAFIVASDHMNEKLKKIKSEPNRFVFIIPFRNTANFINDCANSLIAQSNTNWIAVFCDDASTDGTINNIPKDPRFIIRQNKERITALPNIHYGIINSGANDEDIVCLLDGDDFLVRRDAINIIDNLYKNSDTLLTYGQYMWPNGQHGHCRAYTKDEFQNIRKGNYWASHLKTFKFKLYKDFLEQDPELSSYKDSNNNFYTITSDVAIMTPLMEIAGFDRVKFNSEPVYMYRIHQQNDHFVNPSLQKSVEIEIFSKPKFKEIKL